MVEQVRALTHGKRVLVIADSDHEKRHVLAEIRAYAPMVHVGGYFVGSRLAQRRDGLPPGSNEARRRPPRNSSPAATTSCPTAAGGALPDDAQSQRLSCCCGEMTWPGHLRRTQHRRLGIRREPRPRRPGHRRPFPRACERFGYQTLYEVPVTLQKRLRRELIRAHAESLQQNREAVCDHSVFVWLADWMRWLWSETPAQQDGRRCSPRPGRRWSARWLIHHVSPPPPPTTATAGSTRATPASSSASRAACTASSGARRA